MRIAGFDRDAGNLEKCRQHGVSVAEIEELFEAGAPRVYPGIAHSQSEERLLAIGRTSAGRHVFLAFTTRERDGQQLIRPISARCTHKRAIDAFEKADPKTEER